MIKSTVFCLVTLCVTITYGDIGNMAQNLSACGKLKNDILAKLEGVQADGNQAICAFEKAANIAKDAMKGSDIEKHCTDDCKKVMEMAEEDEKKAREMLTSVNEKLTIKDWQKKMESKLEELKKSEPDRAKMYEEEGKKCQNCAMKHLQSAEKKCKEMNADELVNSVKSACLPEGK